MSTLHSGNLEIDEELKGIHKRLTLSDDWTLKKLREAIEKEHNARHFWVETKPTKTNNGKIVEEKDNQSKNSTLLPFALLAEPNPAEVESKLKKWRSRFEAEISRQMRLKKLFRRPLMNRQKIDYAKARLKMLDNQNPTEMLKLDQRLWKKYTLSKSDCHGGMPRLVSKKCPAKEFVGVEDLFDTLLTFLSDDMALCCGKMEIYRKVCQRYANIGIETIRMFLRNRY
uniref:Uncharacterized protein n=1 Tax=Globodera pallida TaxID=36090 RepID=A0A183CB44_GLOPA